MSDLRFDEKLESLLEEKEFTFQPKSDRFLNVTIEHTLKYEELLDTKNLKQDLLPKEPSY